MEMGESPGGIDKKLSGNHDQKTRFFIKPNLMQLHSSYVVTDPKGTVLVECGKLLSRGAPKLARTESPYAIRKVRSFMSRIRSRYSIPLTLRKVCTITLLRIYIRRRIY